MVVSEKSFREQMKFLKVNNYNVINLDQLMDFMELKSSLPKKSVVITVFVKKTFVVSMEKVKKCTLGSHKKRRQ